MRRLIAGLILFLIVSGLVSLGSRGFVVAQAGDSGDFVVDYGVLALYLVIIIVVMAVLIAAEIWVRKKKAKN